MVDLERCAANSVRRRSSYRTQRGQFDCKAWREGSSWLRRGMGNRVASRIRHFRAVHSGTRPWGGPAGWRKPGALPSCGEGPVFYDQAGVTLEVGLVVGD